MTTQDELSKACRETYQCQVPFQGQEEILLPHILQSNHVIWQQEGLLQSVGEVVGVPSLELPDGRVSWYDCPIQLQLRVPRWIRRTHLGHVPILLTLDRGGLPLALSRLRKL